MNNSLGGVKVVDLASGLGPALIARLLAGLGAEVIRFEPAAGDPFHTVYPGYASLHADAELRLTHSPNDADVGEALAKGDLVLVGGEDYPGFDWRASADAIARLNPHLIILEVSGYPDAPKRPAVDVLVQASSGICYEHYTDRPLRAGFEAASYGVALQGLVAALGALYAGDGQIVRASYYEGALTWAIPFWSSASEAKPSFHFVLPKDPVPLIFECRDGKFIHFVMGSAGAKPKVYAALGIDTSAIDPNDSGQPTGAGDPKKIFGDIDLLAAHAIKIDSADLLAALQRDGVAAELVMAPGEAWSDPQVIHAGLTETLADRTQRVGLPVAGTIALRSAEPDRPDRRNHLPLSGLRVLDFGSFVGGPYGPQCLADLGADVIKVEPLSGEANRTIFKSFISTNRGKRSIALDMKSAAGREIIQQLISTSQIVTSNFRPGVTQRLGIDPQAIHAADPNKIVLEVSGYGRSGPKGALAGWDMVIQALCGLEHRGGGEGNMPLWARSTMVDYATGLLDAVAVLAALIANRNGRGGADLETSLLASGLFLQAELVRAPDGSFVGAPMLNHAQTGFHPSECFYQAADGWIAIAARSEDMASRLSVALDLELPSRSQWGAAEEDAIAGRIATRSARDWLDLFAKANIWAEPCVRHGDAFLDDLSQSPRAAVVEIEETAHGRLRQIGPLFRLSSGECGAPATLAQVGEHTHALLGELGYGDAEIIALRDSGVIR